MTTRKQDYEHAYSAGEAAAEAWYADMADERCASEARCDEWQDFRRQHGLKAESPGIDRMRIAFKDGWNDFGDRYAIETGSAEPGHRTED
jgi:hypothetical protein